LKDVASPNIRRKAEEAMTENFLEVRIKGKNTMVPCRQVEGRTVIALGRWIKLAKVHEEEFTEGDAFRELQQDAA
jgi:hypothetical protein